MKTRLYFLDNLRTFLIFLVVLIHAGLVYEPVLMNNWIVIDPDQSSSIGLIRMYLDLFVMYCIFFVSGYFVPMSAQNKSVADFTLTKIKRIIVPWLMAVITLIPTYKFIFLSSRGLPQEEWYTYFHWFQRTGTDLSFYGNYPTMGWLWFLPVLFCFQMIYLGMRKGQILPEKLKLPKAVLVVFISGLIYSICISQSGLSGWHHSPLIHFQIERLLPYFLVFLLGSFCHQLSVFNADITNRRLYITVNVALTLALGVFTAFALNLFFNSVDPKRNHYFLSQFMDRSMYHATALISMFSFLYILIYSFYKYFNTTNKWLQFMGKYSYAVYIIHMVVIGPIALLLVQAPLPAMVKFPLLTLLVFFVSNGLAHLYNQIFRQNLSWRIAASLLFTVLLLGTISNRPGEDVSEVTTNHNGIQNPRMDIHEATLKGDIETIKNHIQTGTDLNQKEASAGSSPLITAAAFGKFEAAAILIEAGADIDFQNNDGSTALHTAAFFCHTDIVQLLLSNGANAMMTNNAGSIALESVTMPYSSVKGVYDYYAKTFGPLGMKIDHDTIKVRRLIIADILKEYSE